MASTNGKNGAGLNESPAIIEYQTYSGVWVHITPINIATFSAIHLKAKDLFPYPDPKPYQQPEENAFSEDQLTPPEENPEYVALCREVDNQRGQWADKTVFAYAVKFPQYATQQALVEAFVSQLANLREIAVLPEDDYEAVLHHLVLTWDKPVVKNNILQSGESEFNRIVLMAIQTVALTASEVSNGVRFFRAKI